MSGIAATNLGLNSLRGVKNSLPTISLRVPLLPNDMNDISGLLNRIKTNPDPTQRIILEQYAQCANILNQIFFYCPPAPGKEWLKNGIGSCKWEGGFDDDVGGLLLAWGELRSALRKKFIPEAPTSSRACSYHKPGEGCVLGSLKSPKCLGHATDLELPLSFSLLAGGRIKTFLLSILDGKSQIQTKSGKWGDPEANWPKVNEFVAEAKKVLVEAQRNYYLKYGNLPLKVLN
jgi:hypothetical protein